ncbi:MAG TPA: flagellar hook-basal body complex protein FliE [Planctomycetota bacterium]|nr:flagellar hook-basal body complex protein FliE [Planctomycetota bacterium]
MAINSIGGVKPAAVAFPTPQVQRPGGVGGGFGELVGKMIDEVNDKQLTAQKTMNDFAAGKTENVHDVMLAEAEADLSLKMLLTTRNKLVEAYKEIMRMDV